MCRWHKGASVEFYFKEDGKLYCVDPDGIEREVSTKKPKDTKKGK